MDSQTPNRSNLGIHFFYVVLILGASLIFVVTHQWTPQPKFTEFLANAATLASLMLGIIAIIYAFTTNISLSQSLGNISRVSEDIAQTRGQLSDFLRESDALAKSSRENTDELRGISNSVEEHIGALHDALQKVAEQTNTLHSTISSIPSKLEQMESKLSESTELLRQTSSATADKEVNTEAIDTVATAFLQDASISVLIMAYTCVVAARSHKAISLKKLVDAIEVFDESYFDGILAGLNSVELVDSKTIKGDEDESLYVVKRANSKLSEGVKEHLYKKIIKLFDENEKDEEMRRMKEVLLNALADVESEKLLLPINESEI